MKAWLPYVYIFYSNKSHQQIVKPNKSYHPNVANLSSWWTGSLDLNLGFLDSLGFCVKNVMGQGVWVSQCLFFPSLTPSHTKNMFMCGHPALQAQPLSMSSYKQQPFDHSWAQRCTSSFVVPFGRPDLGKLSSSPGCGNRLRAVWVCILDSWVPGPYSINWGRG